MLIANPDMSGINTSANVGEFIRSTEQYAHVYFELQGNIDFSTGEMFYMKVHSPITCQVLFKLEGPGGAFTEVSADITMTNTWEQLTFDFTGAASDTYNKMVIFFDFASFDDNTFYFDDVEGPEYGAGTGPKPLEANDVQDNFEDDGWATITDWKFQDPDLVDLTVVTDPMNSENHVAEYNRSGNFMYTNAQFILDWRMDLSQRNIFDLKVYFPSSNDYTGDLTPTAAVKLQNSLLGGNAWMTQTEVKLTVEEFDAWVDLVFDFSAVADSVNYDQVVVQLGGEGHTVPAMFYFDDIMLEGGVGIFEQPDIVKANVYPNPATDVLFIEGTGELSEISIYSVSGRLVYSSEDVKASVNLDNFTPGVYMLHATGFDGQKYQAKFMVK
jgi:hypothetical protein